MKNVKKIVTTLLALGVMTGFTQAASKKGKPDGVLRLSGGSFAAGIGFSWGGGTLTYKGRQYPISVSGLSLGKVGITKVTADSAPRLPVLGLIPELAPWRITDRVMENGPV